MKKQEKTPEKATNETEINHFPDKEFKALVVKMLTELRKNVNINAEHCIRDLETVKMNQSK